jgi:hypothetical protein
LFLADSLDSKGWLANNCMCCPIETSKNEDGVRVDRVVV